VRGIKISNFTMSVKSTSTCQSSTASSPEEWESSRNTKQQEFAVHQSKGRSMMVDGIGSSWKIKGHMDGFGGRAILQENGKVLAVVLSERSGRRFAYKLLCPTPRFNTQKPHQIRIKGQALYEHMTVRRTSYFSKNFVITDHGGDDSIDYVVRESSRFGPLQLKVYNKNDSNRCCGAVRQFFEDGDVSLSSWQVRADKAMNPKIMICLTAIVNKSMGKWR